jgi:hypothetical protein
LAVGLGIAAAICRPDAPEQSGPAVPAPPWPDPRPVESLQDKNLRHLRTDVIPDLLPVVGRLVPGNEVTVASMTAFGSEVEVELVTAKPLARMTSPARVRLRYCVERQRRLVWSNMDSHPSGWRVQDPDAPLTYHLDVGGKRLTFKGGQEIGREMRVLFERMPRDGRCSGELRTYLFETDPRRPKVPNLNGGPVGVAGNSGHQFLLDDHQLVFVRHSPDDDWRLWDRMDAEAIAANETHLFLRRGTGVWARRLDRPELLETPVATAPNGQKVRHLAATAGRLLVRLDSGLGLWELPLSAPTGGWRQRLADSVFHGFVAHGGHVYTTRDGGLFRAAIDDRDPRWERLGPSPRNEASCMAIWSEEVVAVDEGGGQVRWRPLSAGPDENWRDSNSPYARPGR